MALAFYKYQGTGNDFIMIDNRENLFPTQNRTKTVAELCHRRFGIGADGLILLEKSSQYPFRMVYFNSDGNESTMCGNGGRCLVVFAQDLGLFAGNEITFEAIDGVHTAHIQGSEVRLHMKDVNLIEQHAEGLFLNTGSPHVVTWVDDAAAHKVVEEGRRIRNLNTYLPGGTNVNFVSKRPDGTLFVRTYERGVEDETYSCGTGVTAVALVAATLGYTSPVQLHTPGGKLTISFKAQESGFSDVYLQGPAQKVFEGKIPLPIN